MKKIKTINTCILLLIILIDISYIIYSLNNVSIKLMFLGLIIVPFLLEKLLKIKINEYLKMVYYVFMFSSVFIGSAAAFYLENSWYDKVIHLISGILTSIIAVTFIPKETTLKKNIGFKILFILGFTMLVASIWEFFEFGCDVFLGENMQHTPETGVTDTMLDTISAFIGSLIICVLYYLEAKKNKRKSKFDIILFERKKNIKKKKEK